ncbi:hypothetical protein LXJ58_35105, partial [Escherichia coli]|nr:hypothetical protein [Escherichia coli]
MDWKGKARALVVAAGGVAAGGITPAGADTPTPPGAPTLAQRFGARERVRDISLSPDGTHVAIVGSGATRDTITIIDLATGTPKTMNATMPGSVQLTNCGFSAADR